MRDGRLTLQPSAACAVPPLEAVEAILARRRLELGFKRLVDVCAGLVLLVGLLPLMVLVTAAIRLESPGRALFRQVRSGRRERPFLCYKFRSMITDHGEVVPSNVEAVCQRDGLLLKMARDPRVTRVGAWLRRWSIDEIPQLWNVLKGEMSMVGPRPLMEHMLAPYPEFRAVRAIVRPGMTGLWQIRNREYSTSALYMLSDDLEYLTQFSVALDLRILAATVRAVVRGRGAY